MEKIETTMDTVKCPCCGAELAYRWDELSEEEQAMEGFWCPECGTFVKLPE